MEKDLVSVIMPAYNCEKYISATIDTVTAQTYKNWELIIVDDCATDGTANVIQRYSENDSRIRYIKLEKNSGAAMARNKGIELAKGKYVAFLDSDDIWLPEKLKKQVDFMNSGNYPFSCTSYERINEKGERIGKIMKCKNICTYNTCVWMNPIGNSTVMLDTEKLGKIYVPNIRKRNDYALWLKIMRTTGCCAYGLPEVLTKYLVRDGSISSKKTSLVKYQYRLYRDCENFSALRAAFHVCMWGVIKILHIK